MEIKVSVIVPVFNAEKYLEPCIHSLINQSLKEIEFIFVNDGSVDSSPKIIESYQKKDARIQLINQENQGVSAARNKGIESAKGDYIGFVDADDYLSDSMYETLYTLANNNQVEIITSNFTAQQDGKWMVPKAIFPENKVFDPEEIQQVIYPFLIKKDDLNSCCTKLFKRDFIISTEICFPVGVTNAEDALFILQAFSKANKVVFTNYSGYFYREVEGSASRNILEKDYFKKALEIYAIDYNKITHLKLDAQLLEQLKAQRLVDSTVALLHIYFKPNATLSFSKKYNLVKRIVNNATLQQILTSYWSSLITDANKYKRFVLKCIKNKSMIGLMLAIFYSNFRNRKSK